MAMFTACSIVLSFFIISSTTTSAQTGGFSTTLYHRDSPASPFYDPTLTQPELASRAVARSFTRADHFRRATSASPNSPKATLKGSGGEYLMNISIGTPPFPIIAIADTGSDLVWTQCAPCEGCYKQNIPLFTPKKSSSFRKISCRSSACTSSSETSCNDDNFCGYTVNYGDGSYSNGVISTETITLKSTTTRPVKLPKYIFGCGFDNEGTFRPDGSGIIGLGGGAESLITQLGSKINGKFSYCLIPFTGQNDGVSTINFGQPAVVSGRGVVRTPLIKSTPDTFYYLNLKSFTVGNKNIPFTASSVSGVGDDGNIIIDSGTTLVLLPSDFYSEFESAVSKQIKAKPQPDPSQSLGLCYSDTPSFNPPSITAHFQGADVKLQTLNTFVKISDDLVCLAFAPSRNLAIYGNLAQMNFLIGYDQVSRTLSFKPTDCSNA